MVKEIFEKNNIRYKIAEVPDELLKLIKSDDIIEYLSCMGVNLPFYVSSYGTAKTYLFSIKSIIDEVFCEENHPCIDHGYLVIGK